MDLKDDPLKPPKSPTHQSLIEAGDWVSCMGCHDYHGSHQFKAPLDYDKRFELREIIEYFNGYNQLYGESHAITKEPK